MFEKFKTGDLVIKPRYSPRVKLLLALCIVVVALVSAGLLYNYGLGQAGFERESAVETQQGLRDDTRKLTSENQELRESLARAQRTVQMDQTTYQELDKSLKASAQEIVKLREELNFYRNILSPSDKKSGLRIQSLFIEPTGGNNQFRYKLVLVQGLKHEHNILGQAKFEISGTQVGENAIVILPASGESEIQVNFKYFQDIEGKIELPKNFQPKRIKVSITPSNGVRPVEASYAWPQA